MDRENMHDKQGSVISVTCNIGPLYNVVHLTDEEENSH